MTLFAVLCVIICVTYFGVFCSLILFLTELGYVFVQVAISMFMTGRTFFIIVEMLTYTAFDLYV